MRIHEGERYPIGYGFAWRNYESRSVEAYLIPLNFLARWGRELYIWLAKPHYHERDIIHQRAYKLGYATATEHYEKLLKVQNEEWSRAVGLAILHERGIKIPPKK